MDDKLGMVLSILGFVIVVAFCVAVIYTIFQVGRYFKKKADKQ
jgi:hypothetical protein